MTGEKNRYKTHEQLWKLEDGDLSTPQHDELVLQLLNPENAMKIFLNGEMREVRWSYRLPYISDNISKNEVMDFITQFNSKGSKYNTISIGSEVPIKTNNGFIIGYIDVQISFRHRYKFYLINVGSGVTKIVDSRGMSGINALAHFEMYTDEINLIDDDEEVYNIEVKPKIKSFGETLRQINTYKSFNPNAKYIIYSPDTRFKAAFESQGITFITPSDIGINM